ncbi:hypothetical protein KAR91_50790 [Candidatus Pacearchaeota archaeon]|nr:hypothetical protein [Candidatus Pacearchaeota archaeon]
MPEENQSSENQSSENQGTPTSVVNADGTFTENWYEPFGEENKATLSRFKTLPDLVNSHVATKRKMGVNSDKLFEMPGEHTSDEARTAFHKARGVPDGVEGYKYVKVDGISEKVLVEEKQIAAFKEISKKYNLTDAQFNGVVNDYLKGIGPDIDSMEMAQAEATEQRKQEGNQVLTQMFKDEAPQRKVRANNILDKYGLDKINMPDGTESSIKNELFKENPNLLTSAYMLMLLDKVAGSMSEDSIKGLTPGGSFTNPEQLKSQIAELRANPAYLDRKHAQHKDIRNQMNELYKKNACIK